jgi:hypothetical protein
MSGPTEQEIREKARAIYALGSDDNIAVDDDAKLSRTDDGVWVQAWVWVDNYLLEE